MPAPKKIEKLTAKQLRELEERRAAEIAAAEDQDVLMRGEVAPDDVRVLNLLDELEGSTEATVRIYRQGKGGYRDLTLLDEMSVGEFRPIMLRDEPFNGGDFRVHILDGKGFKGNALLRVEARVKPVVAVAPAADQTATLIAGMVSAMTQGFNQLGKMIVDSSGKQPSRAELLTEMKTMADIFKPATTALPAVVERPQDPFEMLKKVLALKDQLTPATVVGDDGKVSESAMLLSLAKEFFGNLREVRAQAPAQIAQAATEHVNGAERVAVVNDNTQMDEMEETMKMFLGLLVNQAKLNGDVETYANLVLDHAGEEKALSYLAGAEWFDKLVTLHAEVMPHRAWFDELRSAIVEICRESEIPTIVTAANAIKLTVDEEKPTVAVPQENTTH